MATPTPDPHDAPRPASQPASRPADPPAGRSGSRSASSRWALARGVGRTVRRFRRDAAALPAAAWRRWAAVLALGWTLTAAAMLGTATLLRRLGAPLQAADERWLEWLVERSPLPFSAAVYLGVPADTIFLVTVVVGAAALATWRGLPLHALTALATLMLPDGMVVAGWLGWNRARPTLVLDGVAAPGLHSFPSGHVLQAVVIYGVFAWWWQRASRSPVERLLAALLYGLLVALVALTRLRLGAHWPSDVLAALPIGALLLVTLLAALRTGLRAAEHRRS